MALVTVSANRHCRLFAGMRLSAALRQRFVELRALVNIWDPIGLIALGLPEDEYDCIVGPVLRLLESHKSRHEIASYLDCEMSEHFGLSSRS